jgi:sugar lactone lactonase YvrE
MATPTISGDDVRCVLTWDAIVGESPLWHPQERRLYWVDIQGKKVHRFDPKNGRNETFDLPEIVTCLAFRKKGGLLVTLRKTFAFFEPDSGKLEMLAEVETDKSDTRFNDGRVDPQGRFWAGTMGDPAWDKPVGSLYRFDPDQTVTRMCTQVVCSNGTAWSPDGRTMYYTESFRYAIYAFDFDSVTGTLANRRIFAEVDRKLGAFPDGLCVDAEGHVWSNQVGVGRVVRYDPTGRIERQIQFPVPRAVGCTFGGDHLRTLYITSARETMTAQQLQAAPLSGSIFAVEPGVAGQAATPFNG